MAYRIEWTDAAAADRHRLPARQQRIARDAVAEQLAHQPEVETRNRKRLGPNSLARWALRVPPLRVYHDIEDDTVYVRAVIVKERDQTFRRGQEIDTHE